MISTIQPVHTQLSDRMASNRVAFAVEGERMQKPSGSGFGESGSYAELSMMERKEDARGSSRGRAGRPSKGPDGFVISFWEDLKVLFYGLTTNLCPQPPSLACK